MLATGMVIDRLEADTTDLDVVHKLEDDLMEPGKNLARQLQDPMI